MWFYRNKYSNRWTTIYTKSYRSYILIMFFIHINVLLLKENKKEQPISNFSLHIYWYFDKEFWPNAYKHYFCSYYRRNKNHVYIGILIYYVFKETEKYNIKRYSSYCDLRPDGFLLWIKDSLSNMFGIGSVYNIYYEYVL